MLVDQRTESVYVPLNELTSEHKIELANSSLSEMAVLGVRYLHYSFRVCSLICRPVRSWHVLGESQHPAHMGGPVRRLL